MKAIANLVTKTTLFFDHRDPEMVKWLGNKSVDLQVFTF